MMHNLAQPSTIPYVDSPYEAERRAREKAENAVIARIRTAVYTQPNITFEDFSRSLIQSSQDLLAFVAKTANAANPEEYFKYIAQEVKPDYKP